MSQSTVIAAALLAGFVLFLAARNRLSTYAAVMWGSTVAQVPQPVVSSGMGNAASAPGNKGQDSTTGSLLDLFPDLLAFAGA